MNAVVMFLYTVKNVLTVSCITNYCTGVFCSIRRCVPCWTACWRRTTLQPTLPESSMKSTLSLPVSGPSAVLSSRIMCVETYCLLEEILCVTIISLLLVITYFVCFLILPFQLNDYRAEFSRWWSKEMRAVKFPSQGTVFDYYIDSETKKFTPWSEKMVPFELEPDVPLQVWPRITVHRINTQCWPQFGLALQLGLVISCFRQYWFTPQRLSVWHTSWTCCSREANPLC